MPLGLDVPKAGNYADFGTWRFLNNRFCNSFATDEIVPVGFGLNLKIG